MKYSKVDERGKVSTNRNKESALVLSVGGGSPQIKDSLCSHRPTFISFLTTQDDVDSIATIKSEGLHAGVTFTSQVTLIDDPTDPYECLNKAREAVERTFAKGFGKAEILIDYSGGTKHMSVALGIVGTNRGLRFTQCGARVQLNSLSDAAMQEADIASGSRVTTWDFSEVEEMMKVLVLFNQGHYKSAKEIILSHHDRRTKGRETFRRLACLVDGFYLWDLYRHREARDSFRKAKLLELAEIPFRPLRLLAEETEKLLAFLDSLLGSKRLTRRHVLDLYANAERRFAEGKIDDAVLRLYRAVEMGSQERLISEYGIDSADVKAAKLPEAIKEEFLRKYKDTRDGRVRLPLSAGYRLLMEMGDSLGLKFRENEARFRDLQSSRNYSYLAHGLASSRELTYLSLRDFVLELDLVRFDEGPVFPSISLL